MKGQRSGCRNNDPKGDQSKEGKENNDRQSSESDIVWYRSLTRTNKRSFGQRSMIRRRKIFVTDHCPMWERLGTCRGCSGVGSCAGERPSRRRAKGWRCAGGWRRRCAAAGTASTSRSGSWSCTREGERKGGIKINSGNGEGKERRQKGDRELDLAAIPFFVLSLMAPIKSQFAYQEFGEF